MISYRRSQHVEDPVLPQELIVRTCPVEATIGKDIVENYSVTKEARDQAEMKLK